VKYVVKDYRNDEYEAGWHRTYGLRIKDVESGIKNQELKGSI
jgi:primosomal replication protein N